MEHATGLAQSRMMGRRMIPMMAGVLPLVVVGDELFGNPDAPKPGGTIFAGVKGSEVPLKPAPQGKPAAGRNETCPCGSGKKYKKCCLGKA